MLTTYPPHIGKLKQGFTIVEVALSTFLILALLSILFATAGVYKLSRRSNLDTIAAKIASRDIENIRKSPFMELPSVGSLDDPDLAKLPASTSARSYSTYPPGCSPSCSEDIVLATVSINWTDQGLAKNIKLETVISKNGL